jgi:hypothetical protein
MVTNSSSNYYEISVYFGIIVSSDSVDNSPEHELGYGGLWWAEVTIQRYCPVPT